MSTRAKLLITYCASMLSLSLLNILVSAVPSSLSDNALDIVFSLVSQVVCMGIIPLVGTALSKPRKGLSGAEYCRTWAANWRYRMPNPKVWLVVIPLSVSFFYFTQLIARIGTLLLAVVGFSFSTAPGTIYGGVGDLVLWIFIGAVLPAVFEELTHRGLVLDAIFDRGNEAQMILLSGLLFACMHTNILQFLYAFIGGCLFAFITIKTGSIFPAMLLHFVNNCMSHLGEYASQHPTGLWGAIDSATNYFTQSTLGLVLGALLLVANAFLCLWLVARAQQVAAKAPGLEEKWFLRGKKSNAFAISIDFYRPFGKATLADDLPLYAVIAMTSCMTIFTFVWGMVR